MRNYTAMDRLSLRLLKTLLWAFYWKKGMGCRHLEHVLQAMKTGWYHFLSHCMDYGGIFKRLDLAINDMGGLLKKS